MKKGGRERERKEGCDGEGEREGGREGGREGEKLRERKEGGREARREHLGALACWGQTANAHHPRTRAATSARHGASRQWSCRPAANANKRVYLCVCVCLCLYFPSSSGNGGGRQRGGSRQHGQPRFVPGAFRQLRHGGWVVMLFCGTIKSVMEQ